MNKVMLSGKLTGQRFTGAGRSTTYAQFHIECPAEDGDKYPERVDCVVFGALVDTVKRWHDGQAVAVEGRLQTSHYKPRGSKEKKWRTQVVVSRITVAWDALAATPAPPAPPPTPGAPLPTDEDVPF